MKNKLFGKLSMAAAMTVVATQNALATGGDAESLISGAKTSLKNIGDSLADLVLFIIGLVAMVLTVIGFVRYSKSERDSDNALLRIGGGVLIAVIMIYVIKSVLIR